MIVGVFELRFKPAGRVRQFAKLGDHRQRNGLVNVADRKAHRLFAKPLGIVERCHQFLWRGPAVIGAHLVGQRF